MVLPVATDRLHHDRVAGTSTGTSRRIRSGTLSESRLINSGIASRQFRQHCRFGSAVPGHPTAFHQAQDNVLPSCVVTHLADSTGASRHRHSFGFRGCRGLLAMACHPRAGPSGREAAAADPRITALGSTTFPGRRLTRRRPDEVRQTIEMFPDDSRGELARTIRGHLDRNTPEGDCRVPAGLGLPEQLEALGILTLKAPIIHVRGPPVFQWYTVDSTLA